MVKQKRIAMIAAPEDRHGLIDWARYNKLALANTINYATYSTGGELERGAGIQIEKSAKVQLSDNFILDVSFTDSVKGGDQQIGSLIVSGMVDYLFYFWNSSGKEAHDDDIKAVLRGAVNCNIPMACNRSTADHLISSSFFSDENSGKHSRQDKQATIALVAHDGKKPELLQWVKDNKDILGRHKLFATGTTGAIIEKETGLKINKMKSGPKGGDLQTSVLIVEGKLDYLFFFWDPLTVQPHDVDVKALLRNATYYNVSTACNVATANNIVNSFLFPKNPIVENKNKS